MENRKRNIRLRFNLTDKEKELFERKKEESGAKSMSHFIRKTVLEKEIYEADLGPLRDLYGTLYIATNKLNQIARRVNQTGIIYKSDIDDMKKLIEKFSKEQGAIHSLLLKRRKWFSRILILLVSKFNTFKIGIKMLLYL